MLPKPVRRLQIIRFCFQGKFGNLWGQRYRFCTPPITAFRLGSGIGRGDRKAAKYVSKEDALDYVAGYCIVNDVSERKFQMKLSGQWTKGNPVTPLDQLARGL